jgi:hypothetical protein
MKSQEILKNEAANPHERALAPKDCCGCLIYGWKHLEFGIFDGHACFAAVAALLSFVFFLWEMVLISHLSLD